MLFTLEKIWSSSREIPAFTPSSPPDGYGVWTVAFAPEGAQSDPVAYAKNSVLAGAKTVTIWLTVTTPSGEKIRRRSVSGVVPFSARDTAARLVAKANAVSAFFATKAKSMTPADFFEYFRKAAGLSVADPAPKEPQKPDTGAHLDRLLRELRDDLFTRKQWRLLLGDYLDRAPEPERLKPVIPPADRIWADPFLFFSEPGKAWLFFEEMTYREKRGHIAVGLWDGKNLKNIRTALATEHHLSYPQIFMHGGKPRLTVECAASGKVVAYDCEQWPDRWKPGATIFEGAMIDPNIFEYGGRWWLFGNIAAAPGTKADDDLHVFFSDDPLSGKWTPHALNPVVSDARHSRGAGRPYVHNRKLFRPAQDCAGGYGRKVVLREILELTPETYSERTVEILDSSKLGPDAIALHTLNHGRNFVAADYAVRV